MLRSKSFSESKNQVVKLPEDDVVSFAVFAKWLYMGDECDTGAVSRDADGMDIDSNDDEILDGRPPE